MKTHLLAGVPSSGPILAELAFEVINSDNLHHNAALSLFFQIQIPGGSGVGPIEFVPFQGERCEK